MTTPNPNDALDTILLTQRREWAEFYKKYPHPYIKGATGEGMVLEAKHKAQILDQFVSKAKVLEAIGEDGGDLVVEEVKDDGTVVYQINPVDELRHSIKHQLNLTDGEK